MSTNVEKSEQEWKADLSPEQYHVLREHGTERPFTGRYWDDHSEGSYHCAGCGAKLFQSATKFDSGTGWPSFWAAADDSSVRLIKDRSLFMTRTEVRCANCGGHLGHLFEDGPKPTGQRYCMNSAALELRQEEQG